MTIKHIGILFLALFAITTVSIADEIVLKDQHPTNYVIKDGDTLWDIATRFLRDPWRWPDIWSVNPQIRNPHLIYPGDEVVLTFKDGKPQLILKRANTSQDNLRVVKLSPTIRKRQLSKAIPTIPIDAIQQFLSRPSVMSRDELEALPYVLSIRDEHIVAGTGDTIYSRGITPGGATQFSVVREGDEYIDIIDGDEEVVGLEATYIGEARLKKIGDPSTLTIISSNRELLKGDRLMPSVPLNLEYNFSPHAPSKKVEGRIISVVEGVSRIGQFQIVVINKGKEEGMEKGHVMAIMETGKLIDDKLNDSDRDDEVRLPTELSGYLLLFRIFDKVSYALIMKANREISLLDIVTNP